MTINARSARSIQLVCTVHLLALIALLLIITLPATAKDPDASTLSRDQLFAPVQDVHAAIPQPHGGLAATRMNNRWQISGRLNPASATLLFKPENQAWDFSSFSLFSIAMTNAGQGIIHVRCRLDNPGAQDWANSSASQAFILPGETGVVTVAYPRDWSFDDSPEAFEPASSKPNGFRSHWKKFDPANVVAARLTIQSAEPNIQLNNIQLYLAWPYGKQANAELLKLPHLDRYGQAIPFHWPNKINSDNDLHKQRDREVQQLAQQLDIHTFNKYGGYATGPKLTPTGYFRTEKYKGKWWLVDPDGSLFWSHGVCTVANRAGVPLNPERRKLLAEPTIKGTDEHKVATVKVGNDGWGTDFLRLNTYRKYGENWEHKARDITHRRLRAWGMNTLGAWSDTELENDRRTPYTEILHIWPGTHKFDHTPEPYEEGFEQRVHDAVEQLAKTRKHDPWMIGVFIDNEIVWHDNLVQRVLQNGPTQPAYQPFIQTLKDKYKTLDALNRAWGSDSASWQAIKPGNTPAWQDDRIQLFSQLTDRYYRICKEAVQTHLPNHLYLGSRVHTCPPFVAQQIAKHVDVFSINHYAPLADTAQLPKDADLPVMITEFHFGTIGRGVTGMSLSPVHDELQQARSYTAYTTAALLNPHIVGTHWFAYSDQNTVGRPNENYRIGLIDTADTPYHQLTTATRLIGQSMYALRLNHDQPLLKQLQSLLQSMPTQH